MDRRSFLVAGLGLAGGARTGRAAPAAIEKVKDLVVYSSPNHYCGPGPGVVRLPGGELVLAFRRSPFNEWAHGHPDVEACLVRSRDQGATWSEPQVFDSGAITNQNLALPGLSSALYLRGPVVELREGELALAVYTNELRNGQPARRSLLVLSHDGGRTWTLAGTIAVSAPPVGFDETEVYECPSGKLVAFMR